MLLAEPSFEFMRFIQILVWIILPVFLSAIMLTIFLHYKKKKKGDHTSAEDAENNFILATPEQFNHKKNDEGDGEYVFFDHSGLIREYKSRMFYNHARYTALRNDYAKLEAKYSSLHNNKSKLLPDNKNIYMKNYNDETLHVDDNAIEKRELSDKLEQLTRSYQRLEEENRFLQEQISLETAGDDERDKIMNRWKEENKTLREKVTEQEYLEEVLEEKKSQIVFLQNQLEQRIRNQHQADHQRQRANLEMQEAQDQHQSIIHQIDALKNELLQKQENVDKLQMSNCEKEEQLQERQQLLGSKLDHITYLENVLNETKEQNELVNAEAADERDQVKALKQLLSDERSRQQFLEQKLLANKQMLQRLHKEFSVCLNEDVQESPIVSLRPSYINKLNSEETAVH
ncbi:MAG: hypothetical protein ABIR18_03710 [Chitinophagaceae bacterium]